MKELSIVLDESSSKRLYEQIYEYIRDEMKKGKLCEGTKLPSTRSLADFLQVSRSTVDLAYEQLKSEGYIEARPCKGYFICSPAELFSMDSVKEPQPAETRKMPSREYHVDFSPNAINMSQFPYATWKRIMKNINKMPKKLREKC